MLKTLYDHFLVLYDTILPTNPTIASEHALRQEDEIYQQASKTSYRNVYLVSASIATKRYSHFVAGNDTVGSFAQETRYTRLHSS